MKKNIFLIILFVVSFYANGQQKNINNYKYVIVSDKFEFLNEADKYKTSSLTKFLLKKNGYEVYLSSENYPLAIKKDRCNALFADVIDESSMFKTKLKIRFKDCSGKVLYSSNIGQSREKEYKKSYQEAIRNAHSSMSGIKYDALPESAEIQNKVPKQVFVEKEKLKESTEIVADATIIKNKESVVQSNKTTANVLYAQPNKNGFQLINTKPEVVFLLLNTNVKDVYIIKDKNGIFYKIGTIWVAAYYKNENLISEEYKVKF